MSSPGNASRREAPLASERVAQLRQALARRERQIEAMRRAGEALFQGLDGDEIVRRTLDLALDVLDAQSGSLQLYDVAQDELVFHYVVGPAAAALTGRRLPASQGISGQVLRTGAPDLTRHVEQHAALNPLAQCPDAPPDSSTDDALPANDAVSRVEPAREYSRSADAANADAARADATDTGAAKADAQTMITAPLKRPSGAALGVMQLMAGDDADFDAGDLETLQVLCASAATAMENARLSQQARRAELADIIGDISHDIKNMLTPIQSGLWTLEPMLDQLFAELDVLREQSRGRAAETEITRIAALVREDYGWLCGGALLACDQVQARTKEIADALKGELAPPFFETGDLNETARQVARPLFLLAEKTNVQLHLELDADLPPAEFDRKQMYNAIYNLVNNAIPETPPGGSVTIRTRAPQPHDVESVLIPGGETLLLEVQDSGCGMPEHVRVRLFTDEAISTKEGGTGLGTRIVAGVVRRHNGTIAVCSEAGVGTTFSIRLPLHHQPDIAFALSEAEPLPVRRHNLPAPATSFVGRERESRLARELLERSETRLLTLIGTGGTGKTRLALHVAAEMMDDFRDGAWLVSLAPVDEAEHLLPAIAATLGVREDAGRAPLDTLADYLRDKQLLLLLDNFEQLTGAAPLVSDLLARCPQVRVLATSRRALNLRDEREMPVAPLELPPPLAPSASAPSPAQLQRLAQCASIQLFVERAALVQPDFALTAENARDTCAICTRLDGLPLAIELAAAQLKGHSPRALREMLARHFQLPGGAPQDLPQRHQTLRAVIDWSYDLLDARAQELLRRVMVFEGGFKPEAAAAITAEIAPREHATLEDTTREYSRVDDADAARALSLLVEQSLLRCEIRADGGAWYFLLQTIREYGLEKLAQSGELEAMQHRHAAYHLTLAESAHGQLVQAPDAPPRIAGVPAGDATPALWLDWRNRKESDLRAALSWLLDHAGGADAGTTTPGDGAPLHGALRLALVLREVWVGKNWHERREALERALQRSDGAPAEMRLLAMLYIGDLACLQADYEDAGIFGEKALELSRRIEDRWGIGRALGVLANVALERGDLARARSLHEESLALYEEIDNKWAAAWVLYYLGEVAKRAADGQARACFQHSLAAFRELHDPAGAAWSLYNLGIAEYSRHDPAPSERLLEEALATFRELDNQNGVARSLCFLGKMAGDAGDFGRAHLYLDESLELSHRLGDRSTVASTLRNQGDVALSEDHLEKASAALCEAAALLPALNDTTQARDLLLSLTRLAAAQEEMTRVAQLLGALDALAATPQENDELELHVANRARHALGAAAFDAAYQRGCTLNLQDACSMACGTSSPDGEGRDL